MNGATAQRTLRRLQAWLHFEAVRQSFPEHHPPYLHTTTYFHNLPHNLTYDQELCGLTLLAVAIHSGTDLISVVFQQYLDIPLATTRCTASLSCPLYIILELLCLLPGFKWTTQSLSDRALSSSSPLFWPSLIHCSLCSIYSSSQPEPPDQQPSLPTPTLPLSPVSHPHHDQAFSSLWPFSDLLLFLAVSQRFSSCSFWFFFLATRIPAPFLFTVSLPYLHCLYFLSLVSAPRIRDLGPPQIHGPGSICPSIVDNLPAQPSSTPPSSFPN